MFAGLNPVNTLCQNAKAALTEVCTIPVGSGPVIAVTIIRFHRLSFLRHWVKQRWKLKVLSRVRSEHRLVEFE